MVKNVAVTLWTPFTGTPLMDVNCLSDGWSSADAVGALLRNLPLALSPAAVRDPRAVRVWEETLREPATWGRRRQVAVGALADPFHPDVPWSFLARVFKTMLVYPQHDFTLLTVRPGTATRFWKSMLPSSAGNQIPEHIRIGVVLNGSPLDHERIRAARNLPTPVPFVIRSARDRQASIDDLITAQSAALVTPTPGQT